MNFFLKLIVASYTNSTFMHDCMFLNLHLAFNQNPYIMITYYGGSISGNILQSFNKKLELKYLFASTLNY